MKNKIRLIIVEPNGSGGLIHYAYQLCTALANEGMDVTLVTGVDYELAGLPHNFHVNNMLDLWNLFDPQLMRNTHEWFVEKIWQKMRWNIRRGWRAVRLIRAWMRLTRYLSDSKPDVIQFSKINFPFESFFLAQLQRRGLTLTQICHEFELRENKDGHFSGIILKMYTDVYTHFSAMFFHANENRDRFLALFSYYPKEQTHIIPHGNSNWLLDFKPSAKSANQFRSQYGLSNEDRVILFFGLLAPSKGLEDLVDAFVLVRSEAQAKLLIAGYPTKNFDLGQLLNRISELELTDHVILDTRYIPLEEIGSLMELATVVVYPYRSSTQSGALQVAYTFGKPIIATQVGGLPEAVEDGKSGYLVPVESPLDLARKITELINNPKLANEMGAYARILAETRFDWRYIASQIANVYDRLPRAEK